MKFTGYLKQFALTVALSLAIAAGINAVVDPYGLFHIAHIEGFNTLKPSFLQNRLLSKAATVRYVKPEGIILGTSRAEQGYNPDHSGWQSAAPRYNLATPSATMHRTYRYLQHAQSIHPVKQVVLALDFLSFNAYQNAGPIRPYMNVSYAGKPRPLSRWAEVVPSLLSFNALDASYKTVTSQDLEAVRTTYFPNGFQYKSSRAFQFRAPFLKGCRRFIEAVYFPPPRRAYAFQAGPGQRSTLEAFRELVVTAHQEQMDLRMVINPTHAYLMEVLDRSGLWDEFEQWKQALTAINAEEAARRNAKPFPLWDFSGYNSVTTQSIPKERIPNSDAYFYFDASHFKPRVGSWVLDRLFSYEAVGHQPPKDFGRRLTQETVAAHLEAIRAAQVRYRHAHADEVDDVAEAIAKPLKRLRRLQKRAQQPYGAGPSPQQA
ncbi:MAG: hypothetical protein ACFB5Z_20050 [Elainellaceae cyanobacterium]